MPGMRDSGSRARLWSAFALPLIALWLSAPTRGASAPLPPRLDTYLTQVAKITAEQQKQLLAGEAVAKLLEGDSRKEVAVFGAIWVDASMHRYIEAVKDIERFERGGGFKVTRRISAPPRLADFADLRLPKEDVDDLRKCRVGDCEVKLGADEIERFQSDVAWAGPNVHESANVLMRKLVLEYVAGYLAGGNERLAVLRDESEPTSIEREFREMVDGMPALNSYLPDIRRYLLEFPDHQLPEATSFLYWQETEFGLKPTIRVSHVVIREGPNEAVVASKMLYATHYFWTGLELRLLIPDPARGSGFWLVTVSRSRSNGLSGFVGTVLRGRIQREVQQGTLAALRSTKEAIRRAGQH